MRLLELKGMPVQMLIDFVHRHGGILGPCPPLRREISELYKHKEIF